MNDTNQSIASKPADWRSRFAAPDSASAGEVIQVRTLLAHEMESGFRTGNNGDVIPRDIIVNFECRYAGNLVFSAEFFPAIAANPYLAFELTATVSGPIVCRWTDQQGRWAEARHNLAVR